MKVKNKLAITTSQLVRLAYCHLCEKKDDFIYHPVYVNLSPGNFQGSLALKIECIVEKRRSDN